MLKGHQSWVFENKPKIISTATVVGPFEGQGPLAEDFDIIHADLYLGQDSWEKAEKTLMEESAKLAIENAGLTKEQISFHFGGDLMNQIISTSFAARTLSIPYVGMFGACSTSMESLALASFVVNAGAPNTRWPARAAITPALRSNFATRRNTVRKNRRQRNLPSPGPVRPSYR